MRHNVTPIRNTKELLPQRSRNVNGIGRTGVDAFGALDAIGAVADILLAREVGRTFAHAEVAFCTFFRIQPDFNDTDTIENPEYGAGVMPNDR